MLYMQRATLTLLIVFFPILGLLWLGAPWSTSQADFELTGKTLFEEARPSFSDLNAVPEQVAGSSAWLQSEEAAKVIVSNFPRRLVAALAETGDTWGVKLRERMRALACYEQIEAWQIGDKTICSWFGERLRPKTQADQLVVIEERLSINRSGDGRHVNITFRAADPNVATTIVDAFGNALTERHSTARRDLRRGVVGAIEAEFAELTRHKHELEASPTKSESNTEAKEKDLDFALLAKFTAALQRAKNELSANDRQRLGRELDAIKAVARDQPLSHPADRMPLASAERHTEADSAAVPTNSLMLLNHPDWSEPPVVRLSETTTDGFSISEIAAIAFGLSLMIGVASSRIWPNLQDRIDRRHNFYASPYANPHWPNMRIVKETESDKAD